MTTTIVDYRFRVRRRMAANWASINEVLLDSEIGRESDTDKFKIGDGVTAWNDLLYAGPGRVNVAGLADGNVLRWDAASKWWLPAPPGGAGATVFAGPGLVYDQPSGILRVAAAVDVQISTGARMFRRPGVAGTIQMKASGGALPIAWSVDQLPAGMTMDAGGLITDAGTAPNGDTVCHFKAVDAANQETHRRITLSVSDKAAPYWRVKVTACQSGNIVSMVELYMRDTSGGPTLCTGGTPFADSIYNAASGAVAFAFDGATVEGRPPWPWSSANSAFPHFIGYQFQDSATVNEIVIFSRHADSLAQMPASFVVQSSVDSTNGVDGTWTDEWAVSGVTGWVADSSKTFTQP